MLIQPSPPERQTRFQARAPPVPTPNPEASLDIIPAVPQLRAQLDRGTNLKGAAPSRKGGRWPRRSISFSEVVDSFPGLSRTTIKGPGENGKEEEGNSMEEEESEGVPAPVGNPKVLEGQL
ncbi:hypothetical protein O181_006341 [Austropuccinia psidii MF-1]|uniref:Uncharacterized protein n=1 Tax=Austropuccinia psidii MF-1 TaxID=1389203 RepID=A0A9Q3BKQ0_9BASI|nr:hypothetical protein [Austropuccinia psidii MF-1]